MAVGDAVTGVRTGRIETRTNRFRSGGLRAWPRCRWRSGPALPRGPRAHWSSLRPHRVERPHSEAEFELQSDCQAVCVEAPESRSRIQHERGEVNCWLLGPGSRRRAVHRFAFCHQGRVRNGDHSAVRSVEVEDDEQHDRDEPAATRAIRTPRSWEARNIPNTPSASALAKTCSQSTGAGMRLSSAATRVVWASIISLSVST